ncbi:MAG: hypothetical protein KC418_18875 [Anaerolineales bacterium]|nr:hypothetical protein [Anaerolineales bacterium]
MNSLDQLLAEYPPDIMAIASYLTDLLADAVSRINDGFSPKRLSKQPRDVEPLPTDRRQLSSYRTRIGTMLEYALSTEIHTILSERYGKRFLLTFATSHEYPDFYLREDTLTSLLRIEMKAVDAESDEQAARFGTPTAWIDADRDLLLIIGWQWVALHHEVSGDIIGEYPHIFASIVLPAGDLANERDRRLEITGGKIEGEQVLVFSPRKQEYVPDPSNYGKFWRLIHNSRRDANDLSDSVKRFLEFLALIDEKSPRNRF